MPSISFKAPLFYTPKHQKPKKEKNRGVVAGQYAQTLAMVPVGLATAKMTKMMKKASLLSEEQTQILDSAAQAGLKKAGLFGKVSIHKFDEVDIPKISLKEQASYIKSFYESYKDKDPKTAIETLKNLSKKYLGNYSEKDEGALNAIKEAISKNEAYSKMLDNLKDVSIEKGIFDDILDVIARGMGVMFKKGDNAGYLRDANKIITPNKSLQTSVFHEMGHAMNNNFGTITKTLQKNKATFQYVPALVLLVSLMNKRKTTDEKEQNDSIFQKTGDFIKRNAGKLAFLSFVPTLAEEGIASLKGQNIAKELTKDGTLTKELFKKIQATNAFGFSTYTLSALATALSIKFAIAVKDKIQQRAQEKQEMRK